MRKVTAYYQIGNEFNYENCTQEMFNRICVKNSDDEVFDRDAGNLWVYFHESLLSNGKEFLLDTLFKPDGTKIEVAYGYADKMQENLNKFIDECKKDKEKARENEPDILVINSIGCHNNWYIKNDKCEITCYKKEALTIPRKQALELVKKFQNLHPQKRQNGTYIMSVEALNKNEYFRNRIDIVDGEIDDVKYEEEGYTGYYDVSCYSKGKLMYSYTVSTGGDIERYLARCYPNIDYVDEGE